MKYAGHINYRIRQLAPGLWEALFECPAEGCGADGRLTSANEQGPYDGSCRRGHQVHAPSVTRISPN